MPEQTAVSANLAQLVEQVIRNDQVMGSNPLVGSMLEIPKTRFVFGIFYWKNMDDNR